jgi:hypothetical protein
MSPKQLDRQARKVTLRIPLKENGENQKGIPTCFFINKQSTQEHKQSNKQLIIKHFQNEQHVRFEQESAYCQRMGYVVQHGRTGE